MASDDHIEVVVFDDEPQPGAPRVVGQRSAERPPLSGASGLADPIEVVVFEDEPEASPAERVPEVRAALQFDLGLLDPATGAFVVLYSAGTNLAALRPRTVVLSTQEGEPPITLLTLFARFPDGEPTPYLTFQSPRDLRGQSLTLRLTNAVDLRSWIVIGDSGEALALVKPPVSGPGNGSGLSVNPTNPT
jgi:hypothetical protein